MTNPSTGNPQDGNTAHYFDHSPQSRSQKQEFSLQVGARTLTLQSVSGVFSSHGLDKGTAVLLDWASDRELPTLSHADMLCDLGCGSGPIALALAVLFPQCTVYAVDVNERARQLCSENAHRNNVTNIVVAHPDEVPTDVRFSLLWSNPPIRIGKSELHQLLLRWLGHLGSNGVAHLVVSKNLGADSLTSWLNETGFPTVKKASSKGFRILEVTTTPAPDSTTASD